MLDYYSQSFNRRFGIMLVELFLKGKNPTDISKLLGVSRQSIYNWIKRHSELGNQGLKIISEGAQKVLS
jgi:transposase